MKNLLITFLSLFIITNVFANDGLKNSEAKQILIIHSYFPTYIWTNDLSTGIVNQIHQEFPNAVFSFEFLDARRHPEPEYLNKLSDTYSLKYKNQDFDLIFACDDHAYNFIRKYGEPIFSKMPILFCGVNGYKPEHITQGMEMSGLAEKIDISSNLFFIKSILPNTEKILIINGKHSLTEQLISDQIADFKKNNEQDFDIETLDDVTITELKNKLQWLPENTVVLMVLFTQDRENTMFNNVKIAEIVTENTKAPVFGSWDFQLNTGIVGGKLISGYKTGEQIARVGITVLNGIPINSIPVSNATATTHVIDNQFLKDNGISSKNVANSVKIINTNHSNKLSTKTLKIIISIISILILTILIGLVNRRRLLVYQKKIIQSHEEWKSLTQNLPDVIFRINLEGEFQFISRAAEALFRINTKNYLGKTAKQLKLPKKLIRIKNQAIKEILKTELMVEKGFNIGLFEKQHFFNARFVPEYDQQNNITHVLGILQDITQRTEAQKALIKSEENKRSIITLLPDMLFFFDLDGNFSQIENPNSELFFFEREKAIGKSVFDIYPKDIAVKYSKAFQNATLSGKIQEIEYSLEKHNQKKYFESRMVAHNTYILAIVRDITERKKALKALQYETNVSNVLKVIGSEVMMPNLTKKQIAEKALSAALNITKSSVGRVSLVNEKTGETEWLAQTKEFAACDYPQKQCNGHEHICELTLKQQEIFYTNDFNNIYTDQNNIYNCVPMNNCITVSARINHQIIGNIIVANSPNKYNQFYLSSLKQLTDVYGLAIYRRQVEDELIEAKNIAEQSDNLKSQFLSNMSHEIRTPLNGIIGFSELLMQDQESKYENYIQIIKNSGNQLIDIINDILDISKIEAGQLSIGIDEFELNQLLFELFAIFKNQIEINENDIELILDIPDNEVQIINSDRTRIGQIYTNLLSNSLKFTSKGKIVFGYTIEKDNTLKLFVNDTGIGIPKDMQMHIFERFRQVQNTKKLYRGTGIGLSIVKGLIDLLGGTITVKSNENIGTNMTILMPIDNTENNKKTEQLNHKFN